MTNFSEEMVLEVDNSTQEVVFVGEPDLPPEVQADISSVGLPGREGKQGPIGPQGPPGDATDALHFSDLEDHVNSKNPHPVYDDGESYFLLYENAKV